MGREGEGRRGMSFLPSLPGSFLKTPLFDILALHKSVSELQEHTERPTLTRRAGEGREGGRETGRRRREGVKVREREELARIPLARVLSFAEGRCSWKKKLSRSPVKPCSLRNASNRFEPPFKKRARARARTRVRRERKQKVGPASPKHPFDFTPTSFLR